MLVLDSSFLISLYRDSDENNARAIALLREKRNEQLLLCDEVLFETLSVLNYKEGMEKAKEAYADIEGNTRIKTIHLDEGEKKGALEIFFSKNGKVSPIDAAVIYLSRKSGSAPLAFDREILKSA